MALLFKNSLTPAKVDMIWYTNGIPFVQQVDEGEPGQCDSTHQQCTTSVMASHSLNNQMHFVPEPHHQSHASDTSSWLNLAIGDPSSPYGEWSNDLYLNEVLLLSSYGTSGSNVHEFGMPVPMGSDVATEPDIPMQGELHATQFPLDWTHHFGSPGQSASSWVDVQATTVQHSDHGSFIGSDGMTSEMSPFHSQPPATTGYRGYIDSLDTGGGAVNLAPTVQPRDDSSPESDASSTPISTSRPRGQRWPLSNASTFRCMWRSNGMRCSAMIPGDRKSVSSHLRDVHDFTCDGRLMSCQWGECTAGMQRRNIPRHIVTRHFEVRVECPRCGLSMSRADANRKHQLACRGRIGGGQCQTANGSGSGNSDGANRGSTHTRWY